MSEAATQFLLLSPPLDDAAFADERFAEALDRLLTGLDDPLADGLAALLLRDGALAEPELLQRAAGPTARAQAEGLAVLLENRSNLLEASGCDGVHITVSGAQSPIKALRQKFGNAVIIGAGCGNSRHAAMLAGEQGADYIGFGDPDGSQAAAPELIDWWARAMTPPLVAFGAKTLAQARALANGGADFVAIPPAFWLESSEPATAFRALLEMGGTAD